MKKFNDSKWRREQLIEANFGVEYKEKSSDKKWKKTSLSMANKKALEKNAKLLQKQEGWAEIRITNEGKLTEAQADFSTDSYKIADSFTSSELKKLKADGKISVEVYNGASEIQRIWKQNHPTMRIGGGAYRKEILKQLN
jgi:hypothetical protein